MGQVLVSHMDGIARVTLSNPARRNAMTYEMFLELARVFAGLGADRVTRVVLLAGEGAQFSAGGDISQFAALRSEQAGNEAFVAAVDAAVTAPTRCEKPVVAAVRGACMGGALELAAGCDIRFAARQAVFRMPAARLGAGYRFEGIRRFVALIGPARTADLFFSARKFGAAEAQGMGFVDRVVEEDTLEDEALRYCRTIAENAPLTTMAAKASIRAALQDEAQRDMAQVQRRIDACFGTQDQKEGRQAFLDKRTPRFIGQ